MMIVMKEKKKSFAIVYIILLAARLHFIQISSLISTAVQEGMVFEPIAALFSVPPLGIEPKSTV